MNFSVKDGKWSPRGQVCCGGVFMRICCVYVTVSVFDLVLFERENVQRKLVVSVCVGFCFVCDCVGIVSVFAPTRPVCTCV